MIEQELKVEDAEAFSNLADEMAKPGAYLLVEEKAVRRLYPLSEETGMPGVPEGYFWRVEQTYVTVFVSLMCRDFVEEKERYGWFGQHIRSVVRPKDRLVEQISVKDHGDVKGAKYAVQYAAYEVLRFLPKTFREKLEPLALEQLYGDYPPKTLNE